MISIYQLAKAQAIAYLVVFDLGLFVLLHIIQRKKKILIIKYHCRGGETGGDSSRCNTIPLTSQGEREVLKSIKV